MITGDYLETALAIGKELGIADSDDQAIMGKELNEMSEAQQESCKVQESFCQSIS